MIVAAMLAGTMLLLVGLASEAFVGVFGATEDPTGAASLRPESFPDELPLPSRATFVFVLPTRAGDMAVYVYVRRPVVEVVADLEERLAEAGWVVISEHADLSSPGDHLFRVEGHGQRWTIHAEPSVGSATETNVIYTPG